MLFLFLQATLVYGAILGLALSLDSMHFCHLIIRIREGGF